MTWRILQGDAIATLRTLPDEYVQCVVTSPPYWGLRDYQTPGQLGLEATPEEYVAKMVEVFREVRRVLRREGTLWLNIGFSYDGRGNLVDQATWIRNSLLADDWYCKAPIVWHKPNPMPSSQEKRPTLAHEMVWLMARDKGTGYFYDQEAVREPAQDWGTRDRSRWKARDPRHNPDKPHMGGENGNFAERGRNLRTVWTIPTEAFPGAHFATFPRRLVLPCIQAGTSAKGRCPSCGAPWERRVEASGGTIGRDWNQHGRGTADLQIGHTKRRETSDGSYRRTSTGWQPTCRCPALFDPAPCRVLDPFCGSGTVGVVATQLGREFVGIELSPAYCAMAERRIRDPEPELVPGLDERQLALGL